MWCRASENVSASLARHEASFLVDHVYIKRYATYASTSLSLKGGPFSEAFREQAHPIEKFGRRQHRVLERP